MSSANHDDGDPLDPKVDPAPTPPVLYRYIGVKGERLEWLRRLLQDSDLYFPRCSEFNDPFDCRSVALDFNPNPVKREDSWRRELGPSLGGEGGNLDMETKKMVDESGTDAGQERLRTLYYEFLNQQGIVSLSSRPDIMLMWSYYSEGHQGVVVRFNMNCKRDDTPTPTKFSVVEVRYRHRFPRKEHGDTSEFGIVIPMLRTKAKDWQHESEWRMVAWEEFGYIRFPQSLINGVILGIRTCHCVEERIRNWIAGRSAPVELLRMRHKPDSFELEVIPAGDYVKDAARPCRCLPLSE